MVCFIICACAAKFGNVVIVCVVGLPLVTPPIIAVCKLSIMALKQSSKVCEVPMLIGL